MMGETSMQVSSVPLITFMVAQKGEGEVKNTTARRLRGAAAELPHLGAGLNEGA